MLIWWINQADCDAIGRELPTEYPEYLKDQFASRRGRPGRGRLWTHDSLGHAEVDPWPETPLAKVLGEGYGGVVFKEDDLGLLWQLPGVITDTKLNKVPVPPD